MKTTLNKIREHSPCINGWTKLLKHLGKTQADDEPISVVAILDSNGLDDAIWCLRAVDGYQKEMRLYAVWCARKVQHIMTDPRSMAALDIAEKHAHGQATDDELTAARDAAWAASGDAAGAAARAASGDAAGAAAWVAAGAHAADAAWAASGDAAWVAARVAARTAARAASGDAAGAAQEFELRRVLSEIEATHNIKENT